MKDKQKHLRMILDSGLNFHSHVKEKIVSAREGIGVIRYLSKYVSRDVLDQMYKPYVRPQLDYGDIIYHKVDPELSLDFTKKLEATQYSAALAVLRGVPGEGLLNVNFTRSWGGKTSIIEDGTDD